MKFMSLLVVMPMSGQVNVTSLSAKLNVSDLYNRLPKERAVQVKVPKFKLEYTQELQDVFTKLGRTSLFFMVFFMSVTTNTSSYYSVDATPTTINPVLSALC